MIEIPQVIKQSLREVGFDMAETQTIFHLFNCGLSTVADIAASTKLPRSTVHLAVENLIERGVLGTTLSGKRRMVYLENPEKLRKFVEYEQLMTSKKLSQLELVLPELRSYFALRGDSEKIDIEHYEGEDGFVEIFYKSLEQPKGAEVLRIGGDPERFTVARDRLREYRDMRVKKKISTRLLMPEFLSRQELILWLPI
jgi:predicted transcriptional regulator